MFSPPIGMTWMALPFIQKSKGSINSQIYVKKILRSNLISFISEIYNNESFVFWPYQSRSHCSKETIYHINSHDVVFSLKDKNPLNVSQNRPIEKFLANLKKKWMRMAGKQNHVSNRTTNENKIKEVSQKELQMRL